MNNMVNLKVPYCQNCTISGPLSVFFFVCFFCNCNFKVFNILEFLKVPYFQNKNFLAFFHDKEV